MVTKLMRVAGDEVAERKEEAPGATDRIPVSQDGTSGLSDMALILGSGTMW